VIPAAEISRPSVPALDALLGVKLPVLDDGFVRLIDYMGADSAIVQAARVSYGAGTKRESDDRGLIRYLMRHNHTSPFEMCELKLHLRVPMDCWRQWIRHRTASVNEISTRYSVAIDSASVTPADGWRHQSETNRQGGDEPFGVEDGERFSRMETTVQNESRHVYSELLDAGVAREQARKLLPLATYTEAYWKIDLHNLLHFLSLRMDSRSQWEIRQYARTIADEIVAKWVPVTWEAFRDYRFEAVTFSAQERELLSLLFAGNADAVRNRMSGLGWLKDDKLSREGREFEEKLEKIGIGFAGVR